MFFCIFTLHTVGISSHISPLIFLAMLSTNMRTLTFGEDNLFQNDTLGNYSDFFSYR